MLTSIREQWNKAAEIVRNLRTNPVTDLVRLVVVGSPEAGKSTTTDQMRSMLNDALAEAVRHRLTPRPSAELDERVPERFPERTDSMVALQAWLANGRDETELEWNDPPGEQVVLYWENVDPNDAAVKAFFQVVDTSDGIVIVVSPRDLYEISPNERTILLVKLSNLAERGAKAAAAEGKPYRVYIVYSMCDMYAQPHLGQGRVIAGPQERRALRLLRRGAEGARLWLQQVAKDATASAEGRALRHDLLERSLLLWSNLAQCPNIALSDIHGYFIQAKPATVTGTPLTWEQRGLPLLLNDIVDDVLARSARPVPWWTLGAGVAAGVGVLASGASVRSHAQELLAFATENKVAHVWHDPTTQPRQPVLLNERFATAAAAHNEAGQVMLFKALNDPLAGYAKTIAATTDFPTLRAVREANDWEKGIFPTLSPGEQAEAAHWSAHTDAYRAIHQAFTEAEKPLEEARRQAAIVDPAERLTVMLHASRAFVTAKQQATAALHVLRASPLGRRCFVRADVDGVRAHDVKELFDAYATQMETYLAQLQRTVAQRLMSSIEQQPHLYGYWLTQQTDADVAFLKELAPKLPVNPYAKATATKFGLPQGWFMHKAFSELLPLGVSLLVKQSEERALKRVEYQWPTSALYVVLRLRERTNDPGATNHAEYELDLESKELFLLNNGERVRTPLTESAFGQVRHVKTGFTMAPDAIEITGVYLKSDKWAAYERLKLTSRGETAFWWPALVERLPYTDAALSGRPTGALTSEWNQLLAYWQTQKAAQLSRR